MTWPPLEPGEVLLPDPDPAELVFRAVREEQVDEGVVSHVAFALSSQDRLGDRNRLSGAREALQTADGVRADQEDARPDACIEVRGVSIVEIESAGPLRAIDDSVNEPAVTGHTSIDMRVLEAQARSMRRLARTRLAAHATARGRLDTP